jgi:hypothetical protein
MSGHAPGESPKDWKGDFDHENGCYQCRCMECEQMFYGHKRRNWCRECFNKPSPNAAMLQQGETNGPT